MAGDYDILAKFHVDAGIDVGHFVAEKVQTIPDIADTRTLITFKAF
jgi:DNA-binding Lrp family transcriptional regulator